MSPVGSAERYWFTRFVFLRALGAIYFFAFLGLHFQLLPLLGSNGLTPVAVFEQQVRHSAGSTGAAFSELPSLFWLGCSDQTLGAACGFGLALSLAVVTGLTNAIAMAVLWFLYMSFVHLGQVWYGFGWEILLLETGFLAIFLCPICDVRPFPPRDPPPRQLFWLLRWLLFRVMFGAGLIKLRGDSCWRDLTCLAYHYETQPVPNPMSWYLHQMPAWFHAAGVLFNHLVELVVPFLLFWPRRARLVAGILEVSFQAILIVSGNLSFLNWLTATVGLGCFDDAFLLRLLPARTRERLRGPEQEPNAPVSRKVAARALLALVALLSVKPVANMLSPGQVMNTSFDRLDLVNTYGAFGSIGRERDEIILMGTSDEVPGENARWLEYRFKAKPGDVSLRPPILGPYHYRLDWLMWFAAMASPAEHPWILHLVYELLEGNEGVSSLLAYCPFPDRPPRWIKADLYRYRFTTWGDKDWWKREYLGPYMRPFSLDSPQLVAALEELGWLEPAKALRHGRFAPCSGRTDKERDLRTTN